MKHIYVRGQKRKTTSCGTEKSPQKKVILKILHKSLASRSRKETEE